MQETSFGDASSFPSVRELSEWINPSFTSCNFDINRLCYITKFNQGQGGLYMQYSIEILSS